MLVAVFSEVIFKELQSCTITSKKGRSIIGTNHSNHQKKQKLLFWTLAVSCFWLLLVAPCFFFSPFPACFLLMVDLSLWVTLVCFLLLLVVIKFVVHLHRQHYPDHLCLQMLGPHQLPWILMLNNQVWSLSKCYIFTQLNLKLNE